MKSAFGIVHKGEVPGVVAPALPSTTLLAYNNSQRNKKRAAARNFAAKTAGSAVGIGAGYLAYRSGVKRIPYLKTSTMRMVKGKPVTISADKKQGVALSGATTVGGGIGGYIGSKASLERIKRDKKYRYKKG